MKGNIFKRLAAALLVLAMLVPMAAMAEAAAFTPIYALPEGAPELTAEGFLPEDGEEDYYLVFDEDAGEHLDKMFVPDANGNVNLSGNTEALKSMTLVPIFADAVEGA